MLKKNSKSNYMFYVLLEKLRNLKLKIFGEKDFRIAPKEIHGNAQDASNLIFDLLGGDEPCMISRFGSTELNTIITFCEAEEGEHSAIKYILGREPAWWRLDHACHNIQTYSGFFPATHENVRKFVSLALDDCQQIDILGSWLRNEVRVADQLSRSKKVFLTDLEPFWCKHPWTRALKGKRVLVVHPFAKLVLEQYYNHRNELFENEEILPEFFLEAIPSVQSLGGEDNGFCDWFEALDYMKSEIDKHDYDICLIGCGAYGMSLAAHVKRSGKKAVHLGGALQLLFGIKGSRWEDPNYGDIWGVPNGAYQRLLDKPSWIRADGTYRPNKADQVENACYW